MARKKWFCLSDGSRETDEGGETVTIASSVGPDWPRHVVEHGVPIAVAREICQKHNREVWDEDAEND